MKTTLNIAGERVTVTAFGDETCADFGDASVAPNAVESRVPFIYMHEIQDESDAVLKRCAELGCPPFVLVDSCPPVERHAHAMGMSGNFRR